MATAQEHRSGLGAPQNLRWAIAVIAAVVVAFMAVSVLNAIDDGGGSGASAPANAPIGQAAGSINQAAGSPPLPSYVTPRLNQAAGSPPLPSYVTFRVNQAAGSPPLPSYVTPRVGVGSEALAASTERLEGLAAFHTPETFSPELARALAQNPAPAVAGESLDESFAEQGVTSMNPYTRIEEPDVAATTRRHQPR